ncbi:hypothetical protein HY061_01125 [Candidatus Azambacteria bacterium]|nr:hypothetical protein [Candidatus Azambacteria bacterium]
MKLNFKTLVKILIILFALIGFILVFGYLAIRLGLTKTSGIIDNQTKNFLSNPKDYPVFPLAHTPEWIVFRQAVSKDKIIIEKISSEAGIPARMLIALLVPEQMRLFHSNRPLFKKIFEPLKLLGNQNQFSWGIFGIKNETAQLIEKHLKDSKSPFYLGPAFEYLLDFQSSDQDQERFQRIINEGDRTYSYLYAALYLAQIKNQWNQAGFPIDDKPEILATLWNLGFEKSNPKANPSSGGSILPINNTKWSFGSFTSAFYYSDELIEIFPIN